MAFSASLKLGTVGQSILNVKLQSCNSDCSSCTDIPGYESVPVSSFPTSGLTVNNIPNSSKSIKALALGATCTDVVQCISISNIPGDPTATPTPIPTATPTPTPVGPTATPTPTSTPIPPTATPTPTPIGATPTPTPTPTILPGTCYEMAIPYSATTQLGEDLYIIYRKTDGNTVQWVYSAFEDSGENVGYYTINICSETYPSIRYGYSGNIETPEGVIMITEGGGCTTSVDCGGNDPTPPPPTPTPTPIPNDSGLCYTYTLTEEQTLLYSGITVNYTPLGGVSTITVNAISGVETMDNQDGTYTYNICSKTQPIFYDGLYAVDAFQVDQNGACDYENNCFNPIIPPTPTPTPCPENGTIVNEYCSGADYYTITADGSCGTIETISYNDGRCSGGGSSGGY